MEINIAFVGNFVPYKGSSLFKNIVDKYQFYNNYHIKYHIYGHIDSHEYQNINSNIIIHNVYKDENIVKSLHNDSIHGIMHLSLFEESYCYALTNSINSGIPIIYVDRGSFRERLGEKLKYFGSEINDFENTLIKAFEYIILHKGSNFYYDTNKNIQPRRWYLENY
jgi:hypothetical protein